MPRLGGGVLGGGQVLVGREEPTDLPRGSVFVLLDEADEATDLYAVEGGFTGQVLVGLDVPDALPVNSFYVQTDSGGTTAVALYAGPSS